MSYHETERVLFASAHFEPMCIWRNHGFQHIFSRSFYIHYDLQRKTRPCLCSIPVRRLAKKLINFCKIWIGRISVKHILRFTRIWILTKPSEIIKTIHTNNTVRRLNPMIDWSFSTNKMQVETQFHNLHSLRGVIWLKNVSAWKIFSWFSPTRMYLCVLFPEIRLFPYVQQLNLTASLRRLWLHAFSFHTIRSDEPFPIDSNQLRLAIALCTCKERRRNIIKIFKKWTSYICVERWVDAIY